MVIKVTDKRLLEKTGGIVQGMSGSPIVQNGKVIGAVTHVFVNDPTSGYGVHIEWMLHQAGINIYDQRKSELIYIISSLFLLKNSLKFCKSSARGVFVVK